MRDRYRPWIGAFFIVLMHLAACGNNSSSPTFPPTASQTDIPTATQAPTPATLWPTEGWQYSTPEDQGLDSSVLERLSQGIRADVPAARSILVVRNGHLVYEEYFKGDESFAGPVYSVTKSIISALIGIALEEGLIGDIGDAMLDYLGQYDLEEVDPSFKEITIEHLLTMTAGFEFEPMGASNVPAALTEELVSEPGELAAYNSTSTHLLSAILSETAGTSALNMANDRILSRLGIPRPIWSGDGFGVSMGGYGLNLTPRDMAKFGYLYLNEGLWDGEQIIPSSWIEMSTTKQTEWGDSALSSFAEYGYLWWVLPLGEYDAYSAFGAGGQMIMVVPDAEMVVVTTTDSPMTANLVEMVLESMAQSVASSSNSQE